MSNMSTHRVWINQLSIGADRLDYQAVFMSDLFLSFSCSYFPIYISLPTIYDALVKINNFPSLHYHDKMLRSLPIMFGLFFLIATQCLFILNYLFVQQLNNWQWAQIWFSFFDQNNKATPSIAFGPTLNCSFLQVIISSPFPLFTTSTIPSLQYNYKFFFFYFFQYFM